jgi:gluconokinase
MVLVVFGVSGSGKTTIGTRLAETMGWNFYDADNFHPAANVEKMSQGIPLTDADRIPWLDSLRELIKRCKATQENAVLACSALRDSYRKFLQTGGDVRFIYLKGDFNLIEQRLKSRTGHFMKPGLLTSQFKTLEEPKEDVIVVDVAPSPEEIVQTIVKQLLINR